MWELLVLLAVIACVMACGVIPVWYQIRGEKNPSPWVHSAKSEENFEMTDVAATQTTVSVTTPTIPVFNSQQNEVPIFDIGDMHVSEPDAEAWDNINELLLVTKEPNFFNEIVVEPVSLFKEQETEAILNSFVGNQESEVEDVSLSNLSPADYKSIRMNYGEKVAGVITCTPYQGCLGSQVMIGKFSSEENRLEYDQDWVELINGVPKELDGEIIVVKGNFLVDGSFFVQHWEDPLMIDAGYSSFHLQENHA